MARKEYSYIGKGAIYIKVRGATGGMQPIGNCSNFTMSAEEETKSLKDYTRVGGGNINSLSSVSSVTGSITGHDFSPENLALALRGSVVAETAGSVTEEAHTTLGNDGEFIRLENIPDLSETITVVKTDNSPLAENTDYALENSGIVVIGTGGIDATGIKVSYTKSLAYSVEALTSAGLEYSLFFNGANEAQGGKLQTIEIFRGKFSPAQGLGFISDEYGELQMDFEMLADPSVTGAGLSRFVRIKQQS